MRISDWSSDVCSSDLVGYRPFQVIPPFPLASREVGTLFNGSDSGPSPGCANPHGTGKGVAMTSEPKFFEARDGVRSEERRVGKEWVSTCRSRWWPYH